MNDRLHLMSFPTPTASHSVRSGWSLPQIEVVGLLAFCHYLAFVDRAVPAVFAQAIKSEMALTDTQIGALQGPAFALVYAVGALVGVRLAGRLATSSMLVGCMVVWTAATLMFALTTHFEGMVIARVLLGLGQSAFAPAALVALTMALPGDKVARGTSIFTSGSAIGRSGALLLGGALLAVLSGRAMALESWRVVTIALCLPNLLVAVLLYVRGSRHAPQSMTDPGLSETFAYVRRHIGALGPHLIAAAGVILLIQAAGGWIPSILVRSVDMNIAQAAMLTGVIVLFAAPIGHIGGGWMLDRVRTSGCGPAYVIVPGTMTAVMGAALLATATTPAPAIVGIVTIIIGAGAAGLAALAGLFPLVPLPLRRGATGLYFAWVGVIGVGLGPLLTGWLSDHVFDGPQGLALSLAVLVTMAGVMVTLASCSGAQAWRALADRVAEQG